MTRGHKLVPAIKKNLKEARIGALSDSETTAKYQIFEAIRQSRPGCNTFEELENRLLQQGVRVQYKYKGKTNEVQGISFKKGERCFKGSEIDRKYSYLNLKEVLKAQQNQSPIKEIGNFRQAAYPAPSGNQNEIAVLPACEPEAMGQSQFSNGGIWKFIDILVEPDNGGGAGKPYELSEEEKKRRRKKKRPRL